MTNTDTTADVYTPTPGSTPAYGGRTVTRTTTNAGAASPHTEVTA